MDLLVGSKHFIAGSPYISKGFSSADPDNLTGRVFISPSQIDLLLTSKNDNRVLLVESFIISATQPAEWQNAVKAILREKMDFKTIQKEIGMLTSEFVLLPAEYSEPAIAQEWKKTFTASEKKSLLYRDRSEGSTFEVLYLVPKDLKTVLDESLLDYKITHSLTGQIRFFTQYNQGKTIYCNIQSGWFQLLYLHDKELVFANTFSYRSSEDFIYYVMAVYNQFHLDAETVRIILLGEILRESTLFSLLYKYVRNIQFGKPHPKWKFDSDYTFPGHFYFSLFCL